MSQAVAAGRISVEADGRIDPAKADREWAANTRPRKARGVKVIAEETSRMQTARTKHEELRAQRAELELARARGELLERQAVRAAWVAVCTRTRERLLRLPARLADELAGLFDPLEVRRRLEHEIVEVLGRLEQDAPPGLQ